MATESLQVLSLLEPKTVSLIVFTLFSSLRIVSYVPQIFKVARDGNGASAISYATWSLWTGANLATALYACVNLGDVFLATVSCLYAGCCIAVIALTMVKRRHMRLRRSEAGAPAGPSVKAEKDDACRAKCEQYRIRTKLERISC
jgi:hypothetical protein